MKCEGCNTSYNVSGKKYLSTSTGGFIELARWTPLCVACASRIVKETEEKLNG